MAYAKQTFPTIYLKPMTLNEKEAVRDAISDWRADGVQMTDDDATTLIYQWCEQMKAPHVAYFAEMGGENEYMVEADPEQPFGTSWAYDCIFRNSDDVCIGFQIGKFIGTRFHHSMTCIRPAYRNQGYYSELGDQGLKTLFITMKTKFVTILFSILLAGSAIFVGFGSFVFPDYLLKIEDEKR